MKKALKLNKELAEKMGWTNIVSVNGGLLGTPPVGQPSCRGQAVVPNWTGDDSAAFRLMCRELDMQPDHTRSIIVQRAIEALDEAKLGLQRLP